MTINQTLFFIWTSFSMAAQTKNVKTHAHNDYEQKHPLTQALSLGFNAIEVDLVYYKNTLIISHDDQDLDKKPSLQDLYLDPLSIMEAELGEMILLLDIKYNDGMILDRVHHLISKYPMLFDTRNDNSKPIQILLSGDVPRFEIAQQSAYQYFFIDGRPEDLELDLDSHIVPWISTNFAKWSDWDGKTKPQKTRLSKVHELIEQVHKQGKSIRFWKTQDNPLSWTVLMGLGVDIIGVDDQHRLIDFIN